MTDVIKKVIGNATLWNCDCMQYMATLPDKAFELAIVDPPYGIGYAKRRNKTSNSAIQYQPKDWDKSPPDLAYFDQLKRVSENQIIWGGNYFSLSPSRCYIVWDKCQPEGLDQAMCEMAWASFDRSAKIYKTSVQQMQFTRIHPTQKPVKLYEWLLINYAKSGDRILDTHLGSMSSVIACANLGFEITGCELDKDYFDAGCKRVIDAQRQHTLLPPDESPRLVQAGLL